MYTTGDGHLRIFRRGVKLVGLPRLVVTMQIQLDQQDHGSYTLLYSRLNFLHECFRFIREDELLKCHHRCSSREGYYLVEKITLNIASSFHLT